MKLLNSLKKKILIIFISGVIINSGNKNSETELNANEKLQLYINQYQIESSKVIDDIKIDEATYINKIHIPGLIGESYSSNNLLISMIDQLAPVDSFYNSNYWVSHIEFLNSASSNGYEIRFRASYNPPNNSGSGAFTPYYLEFKGKILKGREYEHLEIEDWTILRLEIVENLTCKQYVEVNKTQLELIFCKNVNNVIQNILSLQAKIYFIVNAKSSNGFAVLFPKLTTEDNKITIQDNKFDAIGISQIPFFKYIPPTEELNEAKIRLNTILSNTQKFTFNNFLTSYKTPLNPIQVQNPSQENTTPTSYNQKNIGKIAFYKIDQDPYPYYELKTLIRF